MFGCLATGCANRVRGEVGELEVPVRSAFFFSQEGAFGDDSLIGIVMSSLGDGCQDYAFYQTAIQGLDSPSEQASAWQAVFPEDFWEVGIVLRTGSPTQSLSGSTLTGIPRNKSLDGRGQAYSRITHNLNHRDEAWFDGSGQAGVYIDEFISNGGQLEIVEHTPNSTIRGNFGTAFIDNLEDVQAGVLDIHFKATFCPEADLL